MFSYLYNLATEHYLTVTLVVIACYLISLVWRQQRHNYPPGPKGYPLLGYTPFIYRNSNEVVAELGKQYGDIFMFPVGVHNVVIMNSHKAIKEAFIKQGDIFTGKSTTFKLNESVINFIGIFADEGALWKEQRNFQSSALRDFGVGKLSIEDNILHECDEIIKEIDKRLGKAFCVNPIVANAAGNIMNLICFSMRIPYGDPEFEQFLLCLELIDITVGEITWFDYIPGLHYLLPYHSVLGTLVKQKKILYGFIRKYVEEHIRTLDPNNPRDFTDLYLIDMNKRNNSRTKHPYDKERLIYSLGPFYIAGGSSTAMNVTFAIKYLLMNEEAHKKIVEEIDRVVGSDRRPSWTDRPNMPYTEAVIWESQRLADLVPIGVLKSNKEKTVVLGYDIPKRSIIYVNFQKVHRDPELWDGDPENFRPERFIDASGKFVKRENLWPFGLGKRQCLGENLARMQLFLYLITILQHYDIRAAPGTTFETEGDSVQYTKPFNILASRRK